MKLIVIDKNGTLKYHILSNDINNGHNYQVVIKHDQWFAAKSLDQNGFTLVGCTVAPGFEYSDFEIARRKQLLDLYPQHRSLIMKFTRE